MAGKPVTHEIANGFCKVCGDTAEFFAYTGQPMVDATTRQPVAVDPAAVEACFGRADAR